MDSSRLSSFKGRSTFLRLFFILLFIFLLLRLFYLRLYESDFLEQVSERRIASEYSITAPRGSILDRNNRYLALDIEAFTIQVDFPNFSASHPYVLELLNIIDIKEETFFKKLKGKNKGSIQIKRHLTLEQKNKIQKLGINGISFLRDLRRSYPQEEVSAHVVGITDIDRKGLQGTEKLFDAYLGSIKGSFIGLKDRKGNKLIGERVEAQRGQNIITTLDIRLQSIAYSELESSVKDHGAVSGSIIMVDPKSSEILVMANYPSFKPSNRKKLVDFSSLRNRSAIDLFEPGSVFKPLAMAAIIDFSKLSTDHTVDTSPGWIDFEGYRTSDFRDYGILTLSDIISRSSNVGMVKLCSKVATDFIYDYLSNFGIGSYPSGVLINSREGFLSYTDAVTERDKVSACYGYGVSVTALHLAQAYSVLASNGIYKELRLFKDIENLPIAKERRILSERTTSLVNSMLERTVNSKTGTGKKAKIKGILVAGKTGTSIKIKDNITTYSNIFAGYAPSKNPKLVAIIALHGLKGKKASGSLTAAPVFSRLVEQSLHILESGT